MKSIATQTKSTSMWNRMVHASFRKVVAFDLLCMGIGLIMGTGIGAYLVASGLFQ